VGHQKQISLLDSWLKRMVTYLSSRKSSFTKSEIRAKLREDDRFDDREDWAFDHSIDITIRLWLQINIRDESFRDSGKGVPDVQWNGLKTLTEFLSALSPVAKWELGAKERRLDPYFTGANMMDICDLKIDWTSSLEDHLRLDRVGRVLWIFPYKRTIQAFLSEAENRVSGQRYLPLRDSNFGQLTTADRPYLLAFFKKRYGR